MSPAVAGGLVWGLGVFLAMTQPFEVWSRNVSRTTDLSRHLILMKQMVYQLPLDDYWNDYPRALHALVGMVWRASGGSSYADAWRAMESALWLFLTLMVLAAILVASRIGRGIGLRRPVARVILPAILLIAFLQSMWLTTMFGAGFLTSIGAGLAIRN